MPAPTPRRVHADMESSRRRTYLTPLANRAKRQAISRVPPLRWAADAVHDRRRRFWAARLPSLGPTDAPLVAALDADAISVCALPDLGIPRTDELMAALDRVAEALRGRHPDGVSTLRPSPAELVKDQVLWHWGLEERLLAVVENYLGVPARYYGPDVRREVADHTASGVRQWHRDIEDRRMIKILVWLDDVDERGGPFGYFPVDHSARATRDLRYVSGFITDERLRAVVPRGVAQTVPSPKWTTLVVDNTRLIHRATPPEVRDRYSVTFSYSSRHPVKTMDHVRWDRDQTARIRSGLTPRQQACLPSYLARP